MLRVTQSPVKFQTALTFGMKPDPGVTKQIKEITDFLKEKNLLETRDYTAQRIKTDTNITMIAGPHQQKSSEDYEIIFSNKAQYQQVIDLFTQHLKFQIGEEAPSYDDHHQTDLDFEDTAFTPIAGHSLSPQKPIQESKLFQYANTLWVKVIYS